MKSCDLEELLFRAGDSVCLIERLLEFASKYTSSHVAGK
jgi:hypothetical protein